MLFLQRVRAEILECQASNTEKRYARLCGLLLPWLKNKNNLNVMVQTERFEILDEVLILIEGQECSEIKEVKAVCGKEYILHLDFKSMTVFSQLIETQKALDEFVKNCLKNEGLRSFWLQGLFLSCGYVQDPIKEYRIEFSLKQSKIADIAYRLMKIYFPALKTTVRNKMSVIYTKESKTVEEILTSLKAIKSCFEVMDVKIYKELRNQANRALNCDTANINRMIKASDAQLLAISCLKETGKLEVLPSKMKRVAFCRIQNPQASIKELAITLGETTGMVSYWLRKLIEKAN